MATDLDYINQISKDDIGIVLQAVIRRYNMLFPDWNIMTVSIEKGSDRNEQIDNIIRMFQSLKEL